MAVTSQIAYEAVSVCCRPVALSNKAAGTPAKTRVAVAASKEEKKATSIGPANRSGGARPMMMTRAVKTKNGEKMPFRIASPRMAKRKGFDGMGVYPLTVGASPALAMARKKTKRRISNHTTENRVSRSGGTARGVSQPNNAATGSVMRTKNRKM